jgi:hypothetical protein
MYASYVSDAENYAHSESASRFIFRKVYKKLFEKLIEQCSIVMYNY